MFEHRKEPLLREEAYRRRKLRHAFLALEIVAGCLGIGILGYHFFEGLGWLDSFLNASMILAGEGPVHELKSDAGKWFASFYALFSGVAFITVAGVLFAPIVHRFLHKFHLDMQSK